ncbi:MAG TPA: Gfo/Idh/MocA family oxidoreductase [Chryseosolibacter sp.]
MPKIIRWGILGAGKIANKFASDLRWVEDAELRAIASHDKLKGQQFAQTHNVPIVYNSYEALATSQEVDVVYVATPHGFHYEHTVLLLSHGKAVLCEKAFALNSKQVADMVELATRNRVFLMEAFWTKFIPQYEMVKAMIERGDIGEIKFIQADFGFKAPTPLAQRLYDPLLGGGSLLDIGIYPVFFALALLGKPVALNALMTSYPTGVDEQIVVNMKFANGALAVLSSTFAADTPTEALIAGTEGRIHMRNRFHNPVGHIEYVKGRDEAHPISVKKEEGFGYQYEARHVCECLRKGLTQSPVFSLADSKLLMQTLDDIRQAVGIRYAPDQPN